MCVAAIRIFAELSLHDNKTTTTITANRTLMTKSDFFQRFDCSLCGKEMIEDVRRRFAVNQVKRNENVINSIIMTRKSDLMISISTIRGHLLTHTRSQSL